MLLSILIPVYNESKTIYKLLSQVVEISLSEVRKEIIIVDDGSIDTTNDEIQRFLKDFPLLDIRAFRHTRNQ